MIMCIVQLQCHWKDADSTPRKENRKFPIWRISPEYKGTVQKIRHHKTLKWHLQATHKLESPFMI